MNLSCGSLLLAGLKTKKAQKLKKRKVLIILSNRWNRLEEPRFLELDCDAEGTIYEERKLRGQPGQAVYDEVWENDEAKTDFASCHRFKRHYGHKLQKPKTT